MKLEGEAPGKPGRSRVQLSRICLGTMRLSRAGDVAAAADLLDYAFDAGISSFHCSSEYETFPLFQQAWERTRASQAAGTKIIAKVAAPHFGESRFSAAAFRAKIENYLLALGRDRLDVVQWLLRYDLKQDEERLRILHESADEIGTVVSELQKAGKIGAFVGFPYTASIAGGLIEADYCDGLALYVNPLEREMDGFIEAAGRAGKSVVAIRPFAAGRVFTETQLDADKALAHVFSFPPVSTAVVSASSRKHVDALRPYVQAGA